MASMRFAVLGTSGFVAALFIGRAEAYESERTISVSPTSPPASRTMPVSYSAPRACGDPRSLADLFETRVPELKVSFDSQAAVQFRIERHSTGVRAELRILLEDGGELTRTIEAESCATAVEAIAFVAAVALDPGAEEPLQIRKKNEPEIADQTPEPEGAPSEEPARRLWILIGSARADYGPAPDFIWGGAIAIENASARNSVWAPSMRFGLSYARRGAFVEEAGTARFELGTASLDFCPSQAVSAIFRLQLCGTAEGGVLLSRGLETHSAGRSIRPWVGAGTTLVSEVLLAGPVGLTYRATTIFPFIRDEFQFDTAVFHRVPPVTISLQAGLSARF